jgi:hypothetical protein
MISVHIDLAVRFRPKLPDALGANPAGVFLFANNEIRNNRYQIELVGLWRLCNKRQISRS